jgi:hypothetical protein
MRNAYKTFVEEPEERKSLGRAKLRCEDVRINLGRKLW